MGEGTDATFLAGFTKIWLCSFTVLSTECKKERVKTHVRAPASHTTYLKDITPYEQAQFCRTSSAYELMMTPTTKKAVTPRFAYPTKICVLRISYHWTCQGTKAQVHCLSPPAVSSLWVPTLLKGHPMWFHFRNLCAISQASSPLHPQVPLSLSSLAQ